MKESDKKKIGEAYLRLHSCNEDEGMTNEEAVKIIKQFRDRQGNSSDDIEALDMAIKALEQQPKRGKWLDKKTTIKGGHGLAYGRYGCSVCKKKQPSKTDFCPCCGADMRESEDEE